MKISVCLTAYNGSAFIKEQLSSILHQTKQADEVIICDDCSSDDTIAIVESVLSRENNASCQLIRNQNNLGYKKNFHEAISRATGDIIFLSDQDDVWKPEKIEKMVRLMESNPSILALTSSFSCIDQDGNPIPLRKKDGWINNNLYRHPDIPLGSCLPIPLKDVVFQNVFQGCSMAFTRQIQQLYLRHFDPSIPHDRIIDSLAAYYNGLFFLNEDLFSYRLHGSNEIGLNQKVSFSHKMTAEFRLHPAEETQALLQVLSLLKDSSNEKEIDQYQSFIKKYLQAMDQKSASGLMRLLQNPCYSRLKTGKGKFMDILYCLFSR